jgi:3D (Asp-Asp-Asp) domain-containing protein
MPAKWERCVQEVKHKSPHVNAYAVCTKSTGLTRTGTPTRKNVHHNSIRHKKTARGYTGR